MEEERAAAERGRHVTAVAVGDGEERPPLPAVRWLWDGAVYGHPRLQRQRLHCRHLQVDAAGVRADWFQSPPGDRPTGC